MKTSILQFLLSWKIFEKLLGTWFKTFQQKETVSQYNLPMWKQEKCDFPISIKPRKACGEGATVITYTPIVYADGTQAHRYHNICLPHSIQYSVEKLIEERKRQKRGRAYKMLEKFYKGKPKNLDEMCHEFAQERKNNPPPVLTDEEVRMVGQKLGY